MEIITDEENNTKIAAVEGTVVSVSRDQITPALKAAKFDNFLDLHIISVDCCKQGCMDSIGISVDCCKQGCTDSFDD